MNIMEKIVQHQTAYENLGKVPPPFRMTCAEHKEFVNNWVHRENKNFSRLKSFMGIEIILVQEIEDYN